MPAMSFACSFASASISRASMPGTMTIGRFARESRCAASPRRELVDADFVPLSVGDPVVGTRGSFADANGIAFLTMPCVSKLSPTTNRARVDTWTVKPQTVVVARRLRERDVVLCSSSAHRRPAPPRRCTCP